MVALAEEMLQQVCFSKYDHFATVPNKELKYSIIGESMMLGQ